VRAICRETSNAILLGAMRGQTSSSTIIIAAAVINVDRLD